MVDMCHKNEVEREYDWHAEAAKLKHEKILRYSIAFLVMIGAISAAIIAANPIMVSFIQDETRDAYLFAVLLIGILVFALAFSRLNKLELMIGWNPEYDEKETKNKFAQFLEQRINLIKEKYKLKSEEEILQDILVFIMSFVIIGSFIFSGNETLRNLAMLLVAILVIFLAFILVLSYLINRWKKNSD